MTVISQGLDFDKKVAHLSKSLIDKSAGLLSNLQSFINMAIAFIKTYDDL
jgi:hypothetical protein